MQAEHASPDGRQAGPATRIGIRVPTVKQSPAARDTRGHHERLHGGEHELSRRSPAVPRSRSLKLARAIVGEATRRRGRPLRRSR